MAQLRVQLRCSGEYVYIPEYEKDFSISTLGFSSSGKGDRKINEALISLPERIACIKF